MTLKCNNPQNFFQSFGTSFNHTVIGDLKSLIVFFITLKDSYRVIVFVKHFNKINF